MALSQRDVLIAKMEHFLSSWDAWLCPVAALPAYSHLSSRNPIEQLRATVDVEGKDTVHFGYQRIHWTV